MRQGLPWSRRRMPRGGGVTIVGQWPVPSWETGHLHAACQPDRRQCQESIAHSGSLASGRLQGRIRPSHVEHRSRRLVQNEGAQPTQIALHRSLAGGRPRQRQGPSHLEQLSKSEAYGQRRSPPVGGLVPTTGRA